MGLFRWLNEGGPLDRVDVDGRPVAEVASPLYARTPTEEVACPYADRRRGGVMNLSALRQLGPVWVELLADTARAVGPEPTVGGAWRAVLRGLALPWSSGDPVTRLASVRFKTCLGYSQVLTALLLAQEGLASAHFASLGSADELFRLLDAGGWLVGDQQVCAGPASRIAELAEVLGGRDRVDLDPRAAAQGAAVAERVGAQLALLLRELEGERQGQALPSEAGQRWRGPAAPAWLRPALLRPDYRPAHVERLFEGALPRSVALLLAAPAAELAGLWAQLISNDAAFDLPDLLLLEESRAVG
jgi:hypothetical protein